MQNINSEEALLLDQQIDQEMQVFVQSESDASLKSKVQVKAIGDFIRWIKCVFKDCATEDARKDHEVAEAEKKKDKMEKERKEREEAEKRKSDEVKREQERQKSE